VPSHVTILYPFVPAAGLVPAVREVLAEIARKVEPFDVRFEEVGRFPGVVYLAPEPAGPLSGLTQAVHARFPDYPPYEGEFAEVIPHLTITETLDRGLDETMLGWIADEATRHLPFGVPIDRLDVLVEGVDGHWRGGWRLPLGRYARSADSLARRTHSGSQTVINSRCSPQARRSRSLISPTVA
jgi:hypothetical protein